MFFSRSVYSPERMFFRRSVCVSFSIPACSPGHTYVLQKLLCSTECLYVCSAEGTMFYKRSLFMFFRRCVYFTKGLCVCSSGVYVCS
jgi:hypothetical protein